MDNFSHLDPVALNDWHVVGCIEDLPVDRAIRTVLLGQPIAVGRRGGKIAVWQGEASVDATRTELPVIERFGYVWTTLGTPERDLFEIPEFSEADRRHIIQGVVRVNVSAPRAVENFLDMGHFPFVHTGILGEEPHTEVKPYKVQVSTEPPEIMVTDCEFYQPQANAGSTTGADTEYIYRVPHPFCAVLYKTGSRQRDRRDVIALFGQPVEEDWVLVHIVICLLDEVRDLATLRRFHQTILGQDKPILENQVPKKLPLDPRSEVPIRADAASAAYRRWLRERGLRYGVVAADGIRAH
ncbi:aromatic ring-hydroxylating dioxygenase subunit alpha [Mesorhizobium sp. M7A.F.Ca.US.011.01.1.1]|uniref:aromatic ring-hydroxylating oxygenase subunit alpha n=1 Tax=Mesorhizobium sp. M7A.F.Ca.US.011.01.1.1 TaxID=2496741 RepID=UPI000FCBE391|nr:aromatic ring-hydroxylating dioxygenase subunit alpha [Mesorhizobium sp. M7A.F.Ca.US.011.01.1.1]RUX28306.1 aromatic ring-hydroxylating dioxygenase subunit alpha [Mesorhizobium sp. M7A.F.Ca.US.011.01.1.1]